MIFFVRTVLDRFMKSLYSRRFFASVRGIAVTLPLSLLLCVLPSPPSVYPKDLKEQIHVEENPVKGLVSGKPIRFRIRVVPVPSPKTPVHLHIYLDNRMLLMLTLTHPVTTIQLPPLSPGRHSVVFIEANPLTHQPMEGNGNGEMSGMSSDMHMTDTGTSSDMNMTKMSGSLTAIPARFRLKTLTLIVLPR